MALELLPERHYREFPEAFRYEVNGLPTTTDAAVVRARVGTRFSAVEGAQLDFGFTHDTVWLYLPVHNGSLEQANWILSLNTRFMNELVVYQFAGGEWRELLRNSEDSAFADRPVDYRLLAVPFSLDAGERGELLIGYRSLGTTYLPVSIESAQSFADARALADARSAGFYTAAMLMLLYGLFQWLVLGNRIQLYYILYLGAATLYVFHMDGLSFQFLWPGMPHWNAFAALPLGLLINIAAANFARHFLETWRTAPRFDIAILAVIWLSVLLVLWGIFVESLQVKRAGFWLTAIGSTLYLAAGIRALLAGRRYARFYVLGWIGLCAATVISSLIHSLPGALPVSWSFALTKAGILFDALMFGMAVADQAAEVRRQRDLALAGEMAALAAQAQTRNALQAAEAGRADALRLAREKSLQLASASHDIRQPLAALKVALARFRAMPGGASGDALESVAYLDALVSNYLDNARDPGEVAPAETGGDTRERFPVQLVLDAVHRMFTPEADAKGLRFRCRASSMQVLGDPVATVRIVSNLVKNAIHHTDAGGVLIGCRRDGGRCSVCIVDSGPGIEAGQRDRVLRAFEQGTEAREGHGLGLHIVTDLCERQGYVFSLDSLPGTGSIARVSLPAVG